MMSGQEESKKPEIILKMEQVERVLDEYEALKGLKTVVVPNEVDKYLNLNEDELTKLTAEECGNGAYLLDKMATYVQRSLNKEISRVTWATSQIETMLVKNLGNYSAFKTEDKM